MKIFFFDLTFTDVHTDRQKLGTILENKVVKKLKFSKNDNNKKPSSFKNITLLNRKLFIVFINCGCCSDIYQRFEIFGRDRKVDYNVVFNSFIKSEIFFKPNI